MADESAARETDSRRQLERKWYVRWGRWIESAIKWLIFGYLAVGAVGVIAGLSPLAPMQFLSHEIMRFIPLSNVFAWARDRIARASGIAAPPPIVPVVGVPGGARP